MKVTNQELATILAALSAWEVSTATLRHRFSDIATDAGAFDPLGSDEITGLANRLNRAGPRKMLISDIVSDDREARETQNSLIAMAWRERANAIKGGAPRTKFQIFEVMETAATLWEAALSFHGNEDLAENEWHSAFTIDWKTSGAAHMRATVVAMAHDCLEAWQSAEDADQGSFDWDMAPAWLAFALAEKYGMTGNCHDLKA